MNIDLGSWIGQVGVGGIFVVLVLRMVFDFLEKREKKKNNGNTSDLGATGKKVHILLQKVEKIEKQTQDLYDWHNKEDEEGVKIWYVRRSLEEAITRLSTAIETQTKVLTEMSREQRSTNERLARLSQDLPRLRENSKV